MESCQNRVNQPEDDRRYRAPGEESGWVPQVRQWTRRWGRSFEGVEVGRDARASAHRAAAVEGAEKRARPSAWASGDHLPRVEGARGGASQAQSVCRSPPERASPAHGRGPRFAIAAERPPLRRSPLVMRVRRIEPDVSDARPRLRA